MKTETIKYCNGHFITEDDKPHNDNFFKLTNVLVTGFDKLIKAHIHATAGIESAEFTDLHPDTDELAITARWRYHGLTPSEIDQVEVLFNGLMENLVARSDGLVVMAC